MARVTLPLGAGQFAVHENWGSPEEGGQLGAITGITVDSRDRVVLCQRLDPPIVILDSDGTFVSGWGTDALSDPHGLLVTSDDYVYVVDRDVHRVLKFTIDGTLLAEIGDGTPAFAAPFNHPTDIALTPEGDVYVSDGYGNSHIHRFDASGAHVHSWGGAGSGAGEFAIPHGIAIGPDGTVYVADRENDRVQLFNPDGAFITQWSGFHRPTDIYLDKDNHVFVCDMSTRVHALELDGRYLAGGRSSAPCHNIGGSSTGDLFVTWPLPARRIERWVRQ